MVAARDVRCIEFRFQPAGTRGASTNSRRSETLPIGLGKPRNGYLDTAPAALHVRDMRLRAADPGRPLRLGKAEDYPDRSEFGGSHGPALVMAARAFCGALILIELTPTIAAMSFGTLGSSNSRSISFRAV